MKVIVFILTLSLLLSSALCQNCGNYGTLTLRGDNFLTSQHIRGGSIIQNTVLSDYPDQVGGFYKWSYTYTDTFLNLQDDDIIRIYVSNIGNVGAFKAVLNFDGYISESQVGNPDFTINCALSTNVIGCSSAPVEATHYAATSSAYYGPGTDSMSPTAKWLWTQADGFNPANGVVAFDIPIHCQPKISVTITVCSYEYWYFLALGLPWKHRAALDAWCGPYPPVAGKVTNCYNGAKVLAPACIESYPDFDHIKAGDGSVDWNKRCFLHCVDIEVPTP